MPYDPANPIIVQSDKSILLEVDNPRYEEARDALARFADLEKSPEHIHTYRITPLSLWNAAAAGLDARTIVDTLARYGKYELPANVQVDIADYIGRYGRLLQARALVGVRGAGPSFDGLYYVESVTHSIKRGEYKQSFRLSRGELMSITPRVPV